MTVEEILRQTGYTDEQIKALDPKVTSAFTQVLSTATAAEAKAAQERAEAERAERAQKQYYDTSIAPALDGWANESATLKAERDYYRTQNENARAGGFIPKDAPGFTERDAAGRYVQGANPVPGSPGISQEQFYKAASNITWLQNEHLRLFGQPVADEIETILQGAAAEHMQFRDYVDKKYGFTAKRNEIAAKKQQDVIDGKVKEALATRDKEWAERTGNNPMVRPAAASQFSQVRKAVDQGQRKDPTSMSREERRRYTNELIHKEMSENSQSGAVIN